MQEAPFSSFSSAFASRGAGGVGKTAGVAWSFENGGKVGADVGGVGTNVGAAVGGVGITVGTIVGDGVRP